jgi:hypothetical protein
MSTTHTTKWVWNGLDPTVEQYFLILLKNAASGYTFIVVMSFGVYFPFPDAVLSARKHRGKVILQILSSLLQTSHNNQKAYCMECEFENWT